MENSIIENQGIKVTVKGLINPFFWDTYKYMIYQIYDAISNNFAKILIINKTFEFNKLGFFTTKDKLCELTSNDSVFESQDI